MKWLFVRHGEIPSNVNKVYAGWSEEELTPKGVRQAKDARKKLSELDIDAVYCSPLKRTKQTADIICENLDCLPITNEAFIELRMGPWEGLSEAEVADTYPKEWNLWNTRPAELNLQRRETLEQLQQRVLKGLVSIEENYIDDTSILIVTHVAVMRVIFLHSVLKSLNEYKTIPVENGGIFTFESLSLEKI